MPEKHKIRIWGLDLYRAIAILLVMYVHSIFIIQPLFPDISFLDYLPDGVDLFFVLSGFLIGSILISEIEKKGMSFTLIKDFWIRRWFRTLPNYYLFLAFYLITISIGVTKEDYELKHIMYLFFMQNFYSYHITFFVESWSLCIEEWFYLFFPLLLGVIFISRKYIKPKSAILLSILSFILFSLLFKIYAVYFSSLAELYSLRCIVLARFDTIALGILGAYLKFYFPNVWTKHTKLSFITGVLLYALYSHIPYIGFEKIHDIFTLTFRSFCYLLLLPMADSIPSCKNIFGRFITHISKISYSMYFINMLLAEIIVGHFLFGSNFSFQNTIIIFILFWFLSIILSTLLYRYFEKPLMDLREKIL